MGSFGMGSDLMTDEEILEIAQGLTWYEWWALSDIQDGNCVYESAADDPIIEKGLAYKGAAPDDAPNYPDVVTTASPLGKAVWSWCRLFWGPMM